MSEYEFDRVSLFAENSSPEGVDTIGGRPPRQTQRIPTLSVVLNVDVSSDPLISPSVYAQKGLSLAFPMLKLTSDDGLVEIKYLNTWTKPSGTVGQRSVATQRGYKGFAGKRLTFTAVFDDALPREHEDDVGPYYYTYETIELLRLWAITEVTQKLSPIAYTAGILNIKKYVRPEEQAKIVQAYRDSLKPGGDAAGQAAQGEKFKAAHGTYTENYKLATVFESPAAISPVPPAPLRFQFGNLVLPRCVITKADVTVTRYDGQRATAAEIKIVLQEITAHTLWSAETPNREKLVRLIVNGQLMDVAPPP